MLIPEKHICDFCKNETANFIQIQLPALTDCDWNDGMPTVTHVEFERFDICRACLEKSTNIKCGFRGQAPAIEINSIPPTVPVVHGNWVKATGMMPPEYTGRHVCSVCNHFAPNKFRTEWLSPICPNCGAKMDVEKQG